MYKDKFRFVRKMYCTPCAAHTYNTLLFQYVDEIKLEVWFESPSRSQEQEIKIDFLWLYILYRFINYYIGSYGKERRGLKAEP